MALTKVTGSGANGLTLSSTDLTITSGDLIFGTSAKGPVIGATSNTAANTLDDYEVGSWVPTYKNEGDTNLSIGYQSAYTHARYVKLGPVVQFQMTIAISSVSGDSSGQHLNVNNMPFTAKTYETNSNGGGVVPYASAWDTDPVVGLLLGNSTNFRFYSNHAGTTLKSDALQSSSWVQVYGQYETSS